MAAALEVTDQEVEAQAQMAVAQEHPEAVVVQLAQQIMAAVEAAEGSLPTVIDLEAQEDQGTLS